MKRRRFLGIAAAGAAAAPLNGLGARVPGTAPDASLPDATSPESRPNAAAAVEIFPGVFRFTLGTPEAITPVRTRRHAPGREGLDRLPRVEASPVAPSGSASRRGYLVRVPLAPDEAIYGFGLQLQSFEQRGKKKKLRVNADPRIDSGDSHAPVPFYVTTRGYGVLVDSARYVNVYAGNKVRKPARRRAAPAAGAAEPNASAEPSEVLIEIPEARGADVYVFAGPTLSQAVQRYNLFSGGGPLPPRWGLGVWYRCHVDFAQSDVVRMAAELRQRSIPCDVLGLEPHWQSHSYSCSYLWSDKFPAPKRMIDDLTGEHYRLNLWEHAFTHPTAPIYDALLPRSGDYEVWGGLVPDFLDPEARRIFGELQAREHVSLGVSGYKLDECDNSDFTGNWSFPELSRFPSGADGEQMHSLFGRLYQDTIQAVFDARRQRTFGLVRSSQALAAPYPYVLYSDLYDHGVFIRGVPKAGLSGLLWTPEVRDARNDEDLVRRLQSAVLSPMALINAWYIKNPPWKQVEREANNAGQFSPGWEQLEATCRRVLELRMRLVPYLHAAFVRYHRDGLPPFRPLVMDYPNDANTRTIDDQYLAGDALLVAPVVAGQATRGVYLPAGDWYDFWTGARHAGGQRIDVTPPLEQIPLFVKGGTLLPLAQVTMHTDDPASGALQVLRFGDRGAATLYEENGEFVPALTAVRLAWSAGQSAGTLERDGVSRAPGYRVSEWKAM